MFEVEISDEQDALDVDHVRIRDAIMMILADANLQSAEISLAIVDDATIHRLNREHLNHDYPTDVLSFVLERTAATLDGEIIVSTETALDRAAEFQMPPAAELLLYVIHGMLHLVGYDDKDETKRRLMREQETQYLAKFGICHSRRSISDSASFDL